VEKPALGKDSREEVTPVVREPERTPIRATPVSIVPPAPVSIVPPAPVSIVPPAQPSIVPPPPVSIVPPAPAPKTVAPKPATSLPPKAPATVAPRSPATVAPRSPATVAPKSPATVAPKPAPSKPSQPPKDDDVPALLALLAQWKGFSHFQVLGVAESATPADLKAAFLRLARQYHPDTVSDPSMVELRNAKADLFARGNEAMTVLEDPKARAAYLEDLHSGGKVDVGPILQAEDDFLRATILVKARKYSEAADLLQRAILANSKEPEFRAWLAFARFASAKDRRLQYDEAMAECARVAKEAPKCAAAHLFTGQMAKIMGDAKIAEAAFRKTLELDPNNVDAKRELRGKA